MRKNLVQNWQFSEILLSLFVFSILVFYTYGILQVAPYSGIYINNVTGLIVEIYSKQEQAPALQVGDKLLKIGNITWEDYKRDARVVFFEGVQPGEVVEIIVIRDGREIVVPWKFPGFDQNVFETRFFNIWWLAIIFWLFGLAAQVLVRPRDIQRRLFITIAYLTALWLAFGSLSYSHLWGSSILLHAVTWLILPAYLHFHWVFPRPLKELPNAAWIVFYSLGFALALAEFFQALPKSLYAVGFLAALLGSVILEGLHYLRRKDQRRDILFLITGILVAFIPVIGLGILVIVGSAPTLAPAALFSLPFMPLTYFYLIARRQLGGLKIRVNRFISLYAFLILFGTVFLALAVPVTNLNASFETAVLLGIFIFLGTAYLAITFFPVFQAAVDKRFLNIRLPYENLQETYSSRIAACTSIQDLLGLLEKDFFPSLFIRQYAFLQVREGKLKTLLVKEVPAQDLPAEDGISSLVERGGKYLPALSPSDDWIRLILPLRAGDSLIGFWLLGKRDPDDLYAQVEIPILQAIAHQTAIALSNILQTEQLWKLYQANSERNEKERLAIARDLHDSVLNQLAALRNNLADIDLPPTFQRDYEELTKRLREIVRDLRPEMLTTYGLAAAIKALADNLMERTSDRVKIHADVQAGEERVPENVELQLYRIVQEACENALRHAKASLIRITGLISPQTVDLSVQDDGIGFDMGTQVELDALLTKNHYGLAGMVERARLIGAEIRIQSSLNPGTKIHILWKLP